MKLLIEDSSHCDAAGYCGEGRMSPDALNVLGMIYGGQSV